MEANVKLGLDFTIQVLDFLKKGIHNKKFYQINFADYIPVIIGEGAFSDDIIKLRSNDVSDDFETGFLGDGNTTSLDEIDVEFDSIREPSPFWVKKMSWNMKQIERARLMQNIDIIEQKVDKVKKNWDIGLQELAYLGSKAKKMSGLATLSGATADSTTIPKPLRDMTEVEFIQFVSKFIGAYLANSNSKRPMTAVSIPGKDWGSLAAPMNSLANVSRLEYLKQQLTAFAKGESVEIYPNFLLDQTYDRNSLAKNRLIAYRNDPSTIELNIPINFSIGAVGTANNFNYEAVCYGQPSGVLNLEPTEITYFDYLDA